MRILIVDSDEELLQTVQSYLRRRGHDVQLSSDKLDCFATLHGFVPDVVVLDHGLLRSGGDGFVSAVRDEATRADIPVILIADSEAQFDAQADTNVVDWLQKPFLLSDLLLKIIAISQSLQTDDSQPEPRVQITSERYYDETEPGFASGLIRRESTSGINEFPICFAE